MNSAPTKPSKKKPATVASVLGTILLALLALAAEHFGLIDLSESMDEAPVAVESEPASAPAEPRVVETGPVPASSGSASVYDDGGIIEHERARRSDVIVEAQGVIVHILPDDNEGSRHQRFLLDVSPDLTIKVSHNIDLAPRVPIDEGDVVRVRGEYEWNDLGGVVHWTHHDPRGWHEDGWIEHDGRLYQ